MSMVVYGREALDAARRAGYADGKASGRSEGHTEGRAAEREDFIAMLESALAQFRNKIIDGPSVIAMLKRGAHVGAAKKGGG
jgi:hypothetical protein